MDREQAAGSGVIVGGVTVIAGVIFTCCPYGISVLAPILVTVGLVVVGGVVVTGMSESLLGLIPGVLAGLGVALVLLAASGLATRHFARGDYLRYAGTRVEASVVPASCDWINHSRRGGSDTLGCQDATWTIDGLTHHGSMELDGEDVGTRESDTPVTVSGYAKDDAAVSLSEMDENYGAARVGLIPLWAGGAGLLLTALSLGGAAAVARRQSARS